MTTAWEGKGEEEEQIGVERPGLGDSRQAQGFPEALMAVSQAVLVNLSPFLHWQY